MTLSAILAGLSAQRLATGVGLRTVLVAGTLALSSACLLLAVASRQASPTPFLMLALLIFGAGIGATAVSAHITALTGAPPGHAGVVAAAPDTCFVIGTAVGVALGTTAALAVTSATKKSLH
jgi:fucose permease